MRDEYAVESDNNYETFRTLKSALEFAAVIGEEDGKVRIWKRIGELMLGVTVSK